MHKLVLKPGREKAAAHRHPWLFSGAIAKVDGNPGLGETVIIESASGQFLAHAAYSPHSQIRARVWNWNAQEPVDAAFFARRLIAAIRRREPLLDSTTTAVRLIHGESDGLPGLIVDRYGDTLVMQCLSAGIERWRETLADQLMEITSAMGVYERSDVEVRALEGLPPRVGIITGLVSSQPVVVLENGLAYLVDVVRGQKTGFYLDQRDNRRLIGELARGCEIANCFSYTGGFSVAALAGGAQKVLSIDSSAEALDMAQQNLLLNGLDASHAEFMEADVFKALRQFRDYGRNFDGIILDPPKFAPTAQHVDKAARAYKDINLLGFKLLRPGGWLASFSCSGAIDSLLFHKIVAGAAADAGIDVQIVAHFHGAADHPVALAFPEGEYLKGLLMRRMD